MSRNDLPLGRPTAHSVGAQRVRLSHNEAAIRHMRSSEAQLCGGVTLACRDNALPPLSAYEQWFSDHSRGAPSRYALMTPCKLRRLVQMRRNGCTNQEIANVIGGSAARAGIWFGRLPAELR